MMMALTAALFTLTVLCVSAQQRISPQSNTFNSTFSLSQSQISRAGLNDTTINNVNVAVNFERSNWATGSVQDDAFYSVPKNSSHLSPGSLLKVEMNTNTSMYTLPPNVALSRILFQSETFNGSSVPASAYILWPWMPRRDPRSNKYAVVGWAHGTSGVHGECAPSHIRNLWYQYSAPYILALQGYVVVAPDFVGLGVGEDAHGAKITHPYLNNPSHANDLFFSVEAAQKAFPDELSEHFVLFGHSQGGGAAWGAAQRQAKRPVDGYLGAVAGSPATNPGAQFPITHDPSLAFNLGVTMSATVADSDLSEFLTPEGIKHSTLLTEIGGCNSATQQVDFASLAKPDWYRSPSMLTFQNLTGNGGRPISGPMLVLQGTEDASVPVQLTTKAVNETCAAFPQSEIDYAMFEGADHVPVLYASQRIWLEWIEDRFAGRAPAPPCARRLYEPARSVHSYQKELETYLELATQSYEVA